MAKARRYYYAVVLQCDLPWYGPDQRKERWVMKGKQLVQPTRVLHVKRVYPSKGFNARGEEFPPDYIVTDRPVGKSYTHEVVKKVSRPDFEHPGARKRLDREKASKIKLELIDPDDVTAEIRRAAYDMDWGEELFKDAVEDVKLPSETARLAMAGAKAIAKGA